jgi:dTDP-glucose 4,6-dehydratase
LNIGSILITGGAGFIGSEFVRQSVASKKYSKIFIIDKLTYAADLNRIRKELDTASVEFIECDLNDTARYQSIIPEISYIVHFAAESHVDRSNENGKPFLESNILGTYSLLESARQNTGIRTLLVSTDEVYGSGSRSMWRSGGASREPPLRAAWPHRPVPPRLRDRHRRILQPW